MIVMVTGPPGNGKSYYALRKLAEALDKGKPVATNVEMAPDFARTIARSNPVRRLLGRSAASAERIDRQAYHSDTLTELFKLRLRGKGEGRGVMVLDEAHGWLNARDWSGKDRGELVRFFSQHRKLGWDVYLIVQDAEMIDRQVRALIEYHVHLRNLKRAKVPMLGIPFAPVNMFLALWTWHGTQRSVVRREVFRLGWQKRLYDTHQTHHGVGEDDESAVWLPRLPDPPDAQPPAAAARPGSPSEQDAETTADAAGDEPAEGPAVGAVGERLSNSRSPAKNGGSNSAPPADHVRAARLIRPRAPGG
jgi:zona occludens toxin